MTIFVSDTQFVNASIPKYIILFVSLCYASHEATDFATLIQKKIILCRSDN